MFTALIVLTLLVTVACQVALELSRRRLPAALVASQAERLKELHALADKHRWLTPLARLILLAYLGALAALGFGVESAKYLLLLASLGWTGLSMLDAPNVQHRIAVPFYELSLMLNGAVLALAFLA